MSVLWSVGGDLLYYVCWRYFQTTRIAAIVLVGVTMCLLIGNVEIPAPMWIEVPTEAESVSVWQPFVTEEDLGWPVMDGGEKHLGRDRSCGPIPILRAGSQFVYL